MDNEHAGKLARNGHFFRYWFPYLFQRVEVDGARWAFLPLNRNYKPLGITSRVHVDYDSFAVTHGVKFGRNPALLPVWVNVSDDGSQLWLYSDAPKSRTDYFARLERIMSSSIQVLAPLR